MQRRQLAATRQACVGGVGEREALVVVELGDDGIELGIHAADALEVRGHDLARRHLFRADEPHELCGGQEAEIRGALRLSAQRAGDGRAGDRCRARRDELAAIETFVGHEASLRTNAVSVAADSVTDAAWETYARHRGRMALSTARFGGTP